LIASMLLWNSSCSCRVSLDGFWTFALFEIGDSGSCSNDCAA
jgi:hypothetical protein